MNFKNLRRIAVNAAAVDLDGVPMVLLSEGDELSFRCLSVNIPQALRDAPCGVQAISDLADFCGVRAFGLSRFLRRGGITAERGTP